MSAPPPILGTLETAIYADDLELAERFWREVIGLPLIAKQAGRHVFFRCGAQVLLVFDARRTSEVPRDDRFPVPPHGTQGPGHFCIAVAREQMDAWRSHLTTQGIMIEADFIWPQGGRSIYFRDPAGNSIEIADPAIWDRAGSHRP